MKRTQIYIDWETWRRAKATAALRGQTVSDLIRTTLTSTLKKEDTGDPLEGLSRLGKTFKWPKNTPKNLSTTLDTYLYAPSKPKQK